MSAATFAPAYTKAIPPHHRSPQGDVAPCNNWLGADRAFTRPVENEYGPAGADPAAIEAARNAPAGSTTLETTIRPSGNEWHWLYISLGDGEVESVSIGARREGALPDLVAKVQGRRAREEKARADAQESLNREADTRREIAKRNGYKEGAQLGCIIPNTGKMLRAARIVADHGNGTFDVQGVAGNKQAVIRGWDAGGVEAAVARQAAKKSKNQDVQTVKHHSEERNEQRD